MSLSLPLLLMSRRKSDPNVLFQFIWRDGKTRKIRNENAPGHCENYYRGREDSDVNFDDGKGVRTVYYMLYVTEGLGISDGARGWGT